MIEHGGQLPGMKIEVGVSTKYLSVQYAWEKKVGS
jgi:hypothetical protein